MASLAVMAGGALINALAFSGTNAAFSMLGDHGKAEMKRHNLAMEQLAFARDEYSKDREQRLAYMNKTIKQQRHAEQTFDDLGVAMRQYAEVTGHQLSPLRAPPKLSDFYIPSQKQKGGEIVFIIGGMVIVSIIAYKLF